MNAEIAKKIVDIINIGSPIVVYSPTISADLVKQQLLKIDPSLQPIMVTENNFQEVINDKECIIADLPGESTSTYINFLINQVQLRRNEDGKKSMVMVSPINKLADLDSRIAKQSPVTFGV